MVNVSDGPKPRPYRFHKRRRYVMGIAIEQNDRGDLLYEAMVERLAAIQERKKQEAIARGDLLAFRGKGGR